MSYGQFNVQQRVDALGEVGQLGLSLKPPKWARALVRKVVKGATVTVTNPVTQQPMTVDLSDPEAAKRLRELVASAQLTVGKGGPRLTWAEQAQQAVESVPGGAVTLGVAALALLFLLTRRR